MLTRHFVKGLVTFMVMIIFGLIGIFLIDYFTKGGVLQVSESADEIAE